MQLGIHGAPQLLVYVEEALSLVAISLGLLDE